MSDEKKLFEQAWVKIAGIVATAVITSLAGYLKSSSESDMKTAASYETLAAEVGKLQDMAEKNSIEIARIQGQLSVKEPLRATSGFGGLGSGGLARMPEPSPEPEPAPVQHFKRLPRYNDAVQTYQEKK